MAKRKERLVGIYVRLSKEDSRSGESVSIENQKLMLTKHVKEMNWELKEIYQDDGFSGTNQNRPAFQRMISDVRQGLINTVLIKDLSRLGRNYLEVGNLTEVFLPEHGCELISLNEKLDDMMVFRNWFNEQHSKSTSAKVRASRRVCAESGKFLGAYAPYGFKKDPLNRHKLDIDENTAPVVRKIFEMRASGMGFRAIAAKLNDDGVISPREYYYQSKNCKNPRITTRLWSETSVKDIIKNEAYIGNTVQCKSGTASYKNRKMINKPKDEWIRAEATHAPLIELELWDRVQAFAHRKYKPRRRNDGGTNLFAGLLYCADCGFKLRGQTERRKRVDGSECEYTSYICGAYAHSGKEACTIHRVNEKSLIELIADNIRAHGFPAKCNDEHIIESVLAARKNEAMSCRAAYQSELESCKKRIAKLDLLIENLYEDKVTGLVPESLFMRQIQKYEQDRIECLQSAETAERRIKNIKRGVENDFDWGNIKKSYAKLDFFDSEALLLLIDKIIVSEARHISGKRVCGVKIIYNCIGGIEG